LNLLKIVNNFLIIQIIKI